MKEFILIKSFTAENSKRVKKQKTKQKKGQINPMTYKLQMKTASIPIKSFKNQN